MPGGLSRNLRKGHLAEDLSMLMLRSFCAVADVRQEDDFGVDAVATLLDLQDGYFHAGNSFLVQTKASSITEIPMTDRDVAWLLRQRLPYFVCSVDLSSMSMQIFSAANFHFSIERLIVHNKLELPKSLPTNKGPIITKLSLGMPEKKHYEGEPFTLNEDIPRIFLYPPILTTTLEDSQTDEFARYANKLISEWLEVEYRMIELRNYEIYKCIRVDANGLPDTFGTFNKGSPENHIEIMKNIVPMLEKLTLPISFSNEGETFEAATGLAILHKWFKQHGVDIELDGGSPDMKWIDRLRWPSKQNILEYTERVIDNPNLEEGAVLATARQIPNADGKYLTSLGKISKKVDS